MINTLYLSHQNFKWHNFPNIDKLTYVNVKTFDQYLNDQHGHDVYTSLEDMHLKLENIQHFLDSADRIIFVDINLKFVLETFDKDINAFTWRNLLRLASTCFEKTQGIEFLQELDQNIYKSAHQKRTNDPTIFVAGCSITHGLGVKNSERYGEIVANKLNMPCIFLSKSGASIQWNADRILQADIRPGDIVLWGLTSLTRATLSFDNVYDWTGVPISAYTLLPKTQQIFTLDYFSSQTLITATVKQLLQVENFCKKIGARLYLANLLEHEIVGLLYHSQPNYIDCITNWGDHQNANGWIDLGDKHHPGPLQHQIFADQILSVIQSDTNPRFTNA